jgi:hypothetical protein
MKQTSADVQFGTHHFCLTVKEKWEGIYFTEVLDKDHQTRIGNDGPTGTENTPKMEPLEHAKWEAETDLRRYIENVLKQTWPDNLQILWSMPVEH